LGKGRRRTDEADGEHRHCENLHEFFSIRETSRTYTAAGSNLSREPAVRFRVLARNRSIFAKFINKKAQDVFRYRVKHFDKPAEAGKAADLRHLIIEMDNQKPVLAACSLFFRPGLPLKER
jgi:hypothetical protein